MSTTAAPLKYLFEAVFTDRFEIIQPEDDRSKNHVEGAEHNPSAFRDVLDYAKEHDILTFSLRDQETGNITAVNLETGEFATATGGGFQKFSLEDTPLTDRKVIFFRQVQQQTIGGVTQPAFVARYILGYEGKNVEGKVEKKVIYIDG